MVRARTAIAGYEVEMVPVVVHHRIAHVHAFTDGLTAAELTRASQGRNRTYRRIPLGTEQGTITQLARSDLETALERARRSAPSAAARPSRAGKKGMLIYIDPALSRRLKYLALDEDKTLQQLGVEALEMLLASRSSR